jgi:ABC-2 type transport system permease protein
VIQLLSDAGALLWRELLRYRRERAYWIGQIVFPLVFVGLIGLRLDSVTSLPSGATYASHIGAGMLALVVGSGAVGAGFTLIEDRDTGFLRALLIAPVSRASLVLGKLAARTLASLLLVGFLLLLLGTFTPLGLPHPAAAAIAVVGITTTFVALGVVLASRLRRLESFRLIAALATVPLYLGSGIFYPVDTMPPVMRAFALVNPLTYGVDLLRYGVLGVNEVAVTTSSVMLCVLAMAAILVSILAFDRSTRS